MFSFSDNADLLGTYSTLTKILIQLILAVDQDAGALPRQI